MCRHVGWLGAARTLSSLLVEPGYGLLHQSYAPRRQVHGLMNADGWGVGWWTPEIMVPARWRSARPLWGDPSFASVAPHVSSTAILAAVRSATVGMPQDESAAAPFASGPWLLSHNGRIDRSVLPDTAWRAAESVCDSAVLAAYLLEAPEELGARVAEVGRRDPAARLNILAGDGNRLLATAWGDTLSVLVSRDGVVVASEPYDDDPGWREIPDHSLITATPDGVAVTDLGAA
ncbi:MAG TPA: ergothioneine biosynthesis protein EgtC [Frankiaceae bacterium]|jgi:glutamine amidotransferase|nr:ergothioneine biosynthesis protein EgtC [Frankiaceae bacterium]